MRSAWWLLLAAPGCLGIGPGLDDNAVCTPSVVEGVWQQSGAYEAWLDWFPESSERPQDGIQLDGAPGDHLIHVSSPETPTSFIHYPGLHGSSELTVDLYADRPKQEQVDDVEEFLGRLGVAQEAWPQILDEIFEGWPAHERGEAIIPEPDWPLLWATDRQAEIVLRTAGTAKVEGTLLWWFATDVYRHEGAAVDARDWISTPPFEGIQSIAEVQAAATDWMASIGAPAPTFDGFLVRTLAQLCR